jgi:outer membrane protein with beta-barrel domain
MRAALVCLGLAVAAVPASAQERHGFWLGVGLGYGSLGCNGCDREGGLAGDLALGGTVTPQLQVGLGSNAWYRDFNNGLTLTAGTLVDARVRYYPAPATGFFVTTGVGVSLIHSTFSGFGSSDVTNDDAGFGALLGLGYDIRLGQGNVNLTPFINGLIIRAGGAHMNQGQVGLALSIEKVRAAVDPGESEPPKQYSQPGFSAPPPPPQEVPVPAPPPARPVVGYTDLPDGTNYVGDSRIKVYYPLSCGAQHAIPPDYQVLFQTEAGAVDDGFKRSGDC